MTWPLQTIMCHKKQNSLSRYFASEDKITPTNILPHEKIDKSANCFAGNGRTIIELGLRAVNELDVLGYGRSGPEKSWPVPSIVCMTEMIRIRFAGWISGRIVNLQPDMDIQKLLSNRNRILIRISETLFLIFLWFRLLEKVAHCTIIHLVSSAAPFQPFLPWLQAGTQPTDIFRGGKMM